MKSSVVLEMRDKSTFLHKVHVYNIFGESVSEPLQC